MTISTNTTVENRKNGAGRAVGAGLVLVVLLALALSTLSARATNHELSVAGYADFSYGTDPIPEDPSGKGAQSKVWWHDNFWWAVMFNSTAQAVHIYQLDAHTQTWIDTGVVVDDRFDLVEDIETRADVLSDGNTLYIVSHLKKQDGVFNNNQDKWARLYRFNYVDAQDTYELEGSFPVANYLSEAMVLDMDSTGRLWVAFVARDSRGGAPTNAPTVRISYSDTNGENWVTDSIILPVTPEAATIVDADDIASVVAFTDNDGPKIGVMWSNQVDNQFYFATHPDGSDPEEDWTIEQDLIDNVPAALYPADDHINFAPHPNGSLFAIVKTNNMPDGPVELSPAELMEASGDPLIVALGRTAGGSWTPIMVSPVSSSDTRPIGLVDTSTGGLGELHVFTVSKPTFPQQVCIHTATIENRHSDMAFDADNCAPPGGEAAGSPAALLELVEATPFIGDAATYTTINTPSTVKGWIGAESGILVLASDQPNMYYVHNHEPGTYVQPPLTPLPGTPTGTATGTATSTATSTATTAPPTGTATTTPPTPTATATIGPSPTATSTIPPTHQDTINLPIIIDHLD